MAKLTKTSTPGVFRRHRRDCSGKDYCRCSYAVVWRHRGKQRMETFSTLTEAREAKGKRQAGDRRPASRELFEDHVRQWLDTYRGRTSRGFSENARATYRRDLEHWAIPYFRGCRLEEIEPPDVRAFIGHLDDAGLRATTIRAILAPVKAMYATAVEDGAVRANPTVSVRIGVGRRAEPSREVRAMTRAELSEVLGHIPEPWRLLFELLAHTGLRISEAIGLTWADVELGGNPRLLVRRQDFRGEVGPLKSWQSRRDIPLSPGMVRRLLARRGSRSDSRSGVHEPAGISSRLREPSLPGACSGGESSRASLGDVPQLPSHLRFPPLRGRPRRKANL